MPIFDFECTKCGKKFSKLVLSPSAEDGVTCKYCASADVRKLITGFSTVSGSPGGFFDHGTSLGGGCSDTG